MSYQAETAEQRFRAAFERLKEGKPITLPKGTPVSQNNVAKEAGADPSALRKSRYPALIREIQAWVELDNARDKKQKQRQEKARAAREDDAAQIGRLTRQRDAVQSQLISVQHQVLELLGENARLQARVDELLPPPTTLRR